MGGRFASQTTGTALNTLPANSSEVTIYATAPVTLLDDNANVLVAWGFAFTAGTGTTTMNVIIRRGVALVGAEIVAGANSHDVIAGKTYIISGSSVDQPGPGTVAYFLSVSQAGATGSGTVTDGTLLTAVF